MEGTMPPSRSTQSQMIQDIYDTLIQKLPELASNVARLMEKVDSSVAISQENQRTLRGFNGNEGLLGRVSQIENHTNTIPDLKCTVERIEHEQEQLSNQLSDHLSKHSEQAEKEKKNLERRQGNQDKVSLVVITVLITQVMAILSSGVLIYLNWK